MSSIRKPARWLLLLVAMSMIAAACGDGGGGEDPGTTDGTDGEEQEQAEAGGEFSVYICEPEALFPQNANETCGAEVLNALYTALVDYDVETSEPLWGDESERAIAESIESDDQTNWTIKLKEGWTFHNGEPVTAQSFVDAWNYGAYQPNAQGNSYFMANIEGYDQLQCAEEDTDEEGNCTADPPSEEMSGLTAVDDTTLEVTLDGPFSQFPLTLGYTAFYPVSEEALEDPEAANEAPIGTGPFQMDGEWVHDESVKVVRYEDYSGKPAQADGIEFRIYSEIDTAYNDLLAGGVDILDDIPSAQLDAAREEFGDRFIEDESSTWTYLGFPTGEEKFSDVNLRKAFSMAIDREAITETIKTDSVPADAFISPVVAGYEEGLCGENCTFNPDRAKELLEEAGGWDGTLTLWFNSGADHEQWMEAVSNQLRTNLGINDIKFRSLEFAEYLGLLDQGKVNGPFRLGWVMDYPSPQNYLEPIFSTIGSTNYFEFDNEEFNDLVRQGNEAGTIEDGLDDYLEAHQILVDEMPAIPMFFGRVTGAHTERVEGVNIDAFTRINTADISVTE